MKATILFGVALLAAASGCALNEPSRSSTLLQPVRPDVRSAGQATNGAIFQAGTSRSLFEDRRARSVGDTLVINIVEKTQGKKKSSTSADRSHDTTFSVPGVTGLPFKTLQGMGVTAQNQTKFSGTGDSESTNDLTGTITCTVIDVLANGNLVVSGEKRIAINQADDRVKFYGVVNPLYISVSNTVDSSYVADARIEYKGEGFTNDTQTMGWLGRFFLSVLPF